MSLKFDATLLPEATNNRCDMDKVADAILTMQVEKVGNVEADHSKLVEKAIAPLRGFGEFQVRRGIWKRVGRMLEDGGGLR